MPHYNGEKQKNTNAFFVPNAPIGVALHLHETGARQTRVLGRSRSCDDLRESNVPNELVIAENLGGGGIIALLTLSKTE